MGAYIQESLLNAVKIMFFCLTPWLAVALLMQLLSSMLRSLLARKIGTMTYVYLTAPGVMVHELSHAFFCLLFGHSITEMQLFSPQEDGTLGYVSHKYNPRNFFHQIGNFFIGTGPIWGGAALLWLLSCWLLPESVTAGDKSIPLQMLEFMKMFFTLSFWSSWQGWLWLYLAFTISLHITLSPADLKGALAGFCFLLFLILFCCLSFGWCGRWEASLIDGMLLAFGAVLPLFVLALLVLLMGLAILCAFR